MLFVLASTDPIMMEPTTPPHLVANGRVWIDTQDGAFLGYGRIELLEKIRDTGSIRQAALDMKMSYQQAWKLVNQMNERAGTPLVSLQRGGKGGGATLLTETGEKAIAAFHTFNEAFQQFLRHYQVSL